MRVFHNFSEKILFAANAFWSACIRLRFRKPHQPQTILVVKWDEIGDMVVALHLFHYIKSAYPNAVLDVLCKPLLAPVLQSNPSVHQVLTSTRQWNMKYDMVIELRGTFKTLLKSVFYPPKWRLDKGTTRLKLLNTPTKPNDRKVNEMVLHPLIPVGSYHVQRFFPDSNDVNVVRQLIPTLPFTIMHVKANKLLKEWPADRFALISDYLFSEFGLATVCIGTQSERDEISQFCDTVNHSCIFNLAGQLTLNQLYVLCTHARLYIGNDSGPMHIANAAGLPLIGLFGPGPAEIFYPEGEHVQILHHVLPCNPCDQITCVIPEQSCMKRITTTEVIININTLLRHEIIPNK
jgi:heptosyltransferase III